MPPPLQVPPGLIKPPTNEQTAMPDMPLEAAKNSAKPLDTTPPELQLDTGGDEQSEPRGQGDDQSISRSVNEIDTPARRPGL